MTDPVFSSIVAASADPILGVTAKFHADPRPEKVNLGVGMYLDDSGKPTTLQVVREEELAMANVDVPHTYLPIRGLPAYRTAAQKMVFGETSELVLSGRIATVQSLGGTGALKVGTDFAKLVCGISIGAASNPTWGNHYSILKNAGLSVAKYHYFDTTIGDLNFDQMVEDLNQLPEHSLVILHSCCHNPTGYDLSEEQWKAVLELCIRKRHLPFLDMAYQGFKQGLEQDAFAIRLFSDSGISFMVATSFSKSFGLYGERIGALHVVTQSKQEADCVITQLEAIIRSNYSNPPAHGARLVEAILTNGAKRTRWEAELASMRLRIRSMRKALCEYMASLGATRDFSFVLQQAGMFSFTGFTPEQVDRLADEFGIYAVRNGRICICGLNTRNVQYVAQAFVTVENF